MYDPKETRDDLNKTKQNMPTFDGDKAFKGVSDFIQKNHGESDEVRRDRDRKAYANNPAKSTYGATTPSLAGNGVRSTFDPNNYGSRLTHPQGEERHIDLVTQPMPKGNIRFFAKAKEFLGTTKGKLVACGMTVAILAGSAYVTFVNVTQHANFENATAIAQTIDLPNEVYGNVDMEVQANGEAYFTDSDGNKFKAYNNAEAETVAQRYGSPDVNEKIIPTEAEYEAGLTQEQLAEKRAIDMQMSEQGRSR